MTAAGIPVEVCAGAGLVAGGYLYSWPCVCGVGRSHHWNTEAAMVHEEEEWKVK
mgnify:CR=1 FL=1